MKKLFLSTTVLAAILLSCGKNDDTQPEVDPPVKIDSTNAFAVDGKLFKTPYVWMDNNSTDPGELNFTSVDLSKTNDTSVIHGILIEVDELTDGKTYTYHDSKTAGFDKTQHFADADFVYDAALVDGSAVGGTAAIDVALKSGSLKVTKKANDEYSFEYTLEYVNNKKVVGNYSGKIRITE